jgi:cysteine desulfurase / selenocysteine lyase
MTFDVDALRADFPALSQTVGGKPLVYLDNACMTLKPEPVLRAMERYYREFPGCHGRAAHAFARKATEAYEQARASLAALIGAPSPGQVVFTKNTTEAINLVAGGFRWRSGDEILTSDLEHNSNLLPWEVARRQHGVVVRRFALAPDSTFDRDAFEAALSPRVRLVSVFHTSNVTGVSLPLEWIVERAHQNGSRVLVDASQGVGVEPLDVASLGVDLLAMSMHKVMGPTGVGLLYGKREVLEELSPLLYGGEMVADVHHGEFALAPIPDRFEAGLQNYAGIIGAGAAAGYLRDLPRQEATRHLTQLNRVATEGLAGVERIHILGPAAAEDRHGVLNFQLRGTPSEHVARILDESRNIMVRAGVHCAHAWFHATGRETSVRASFYLYNTTQEAELLARSVSEIARFFG